MNQLSYNINVRTNGAMCEMGPKMERAGTKVKNMDAIMEILGKGKEEKKVAWEIKSYVRYNHFASTWAGETKRVNCYQKVMSMLSSINIHVTAQK